jgi:hypothetical protein
MENCQGLGCKLRLTRWIPNGVVFKNRLNSKFGLANWPLGLTCKAFRVHLAEYLFYHWIALNFVRVHHQLQNYLLAEFCTAQWLQVYPALKGEEKMYNIL